MTTLEIIVFAWLTCSLIVAVVNMCRIEATDGTEMYVDPFYDAKWYWLWLIIPMPIIVYAIEIFKYASKKHIGGKR